MDKNLEGWQDDKPESILVPVMPTRSMIRAGGKLSVVKDPMMANLNAMAIYRAMIEAASPPTTEKEGQ